MKGKLLIASVLASVQALTMYTAVQGAASNEHFISVNGAATAGSNYENNAASGMSAVAIGEGASASMDRAIAIGKGAVVGREGGSANEGIAIGTGAYSHAMSDANHERIIKFGRESANMAGGIAIGAKTHARISSMDIGNRDYVGDIGDMVGASAYGQGAYTANNVITGIGATTVGDNSINSANFSAINGSFNVISKAFDKSTAGWAGSQIQRGANALHNAGAAIQGFGSTITGSLNSIEGAEPLEGNVFAVLGGGKPATGLMFSGMSSNVIGLANRMNKSNGVLMIGTGNEVTNSYLTPTKEVVIDSMKTNVPFFGEVSLNPTVKTGNINELAQSLRKYAKDNRLASVGVMGSANSVDRALFSTVSGVGNTLTGKGTAALTELNTATKRDENYEDFSAFNQITGYENTANDVHRTVTSGNHNRLEKTDDTMVNGLRNEMNETEKSLVMGQYWNVQGAQGDRASRNVLIGFNDDGQSVLKASAKDIVAIGANITANTDNSVYLGMGSADASGLTSKQMNAYASDTVDLQDGRQIKLDFAGGTPVGVVSLGYKDEERRVQNVAAGWISETSTDAINGSQLYSAMKNLSPAISVFNGGSLSSGSYAKGVQITPSVTSFDFGDGLKAVEVVDGTTKRVHVGLDKEALKNDPAFKGPKGDKGDAGAAGAVGPQGPKGDKGDAGAAGVAGPQGPQGPKGDKGDAGAAGVAGPQGPKGDKGDAGVAGAVGPQGPKGDKGDAGVAGAAGPQGPKGDKGDAGVAGKDGKNGKDGRDGVDGKDGKDGAPGLGVDPETIRSLESARNEVRGVGALSAALAGLKPIQYDPMEPTQIMASVGTYRGNQAVALGVARYKNESTMFHAGLAYGSGDAKHVMANMGVTWKFGDKAEERAVEERYRRGPVSSAYVLQNEMTAVKEANARLTAENEGMRQEMDAMKAQIAYLLNKVQ